VCVCVYVYVYVFVCVCVYVLLAQHECDHFDGILFPARVEDPNKHFGFVEEINRRLSVPSQDSHQ